MDALKKISKCVGFQWDEGNIDKNWIKHAVSPAECEQIFFIQPLIVGQDEKHSQKEERYFVLGKIDTNRHIFVVCTIRKKLVRIISARDMNPKERRIYESYEE